MMQAISRKLFRREDGYEVWKEMTRLDFDAGVIDDAGDPEWAEDFVEKLEDASGRITTIESCYTPDGAYIGNEGTAKFLCVEKGIKPELKNGASVCSIGFCEKEQKWYGWSHRAIFGFGIGSEVKLGDCGYMPANRKDFEIDCTRFWSDEHHAETWGVEATGPGGEVGTQVNWCYAETAPNKKLRKTISGVFTPYPDQWGRGSWTAETLEDARQMAMDFAEGVS